MQKIYYISRVLTEQVEFANIIIINKVDLISEQELKKLVSVLRSLNTDAYFIMASQGQVSIADIVDTGLFNFDEASRAPLRVKEMEGGGHRNHTPETDEYGISSFVYTRERPFDMQKLVAILEQGLPGVVRGKGVVRLDNDPVYAHEFAIAGGEVSVIPFARWMASQTRQELEMNGLRNDYLAVKDLPHKDRVVELVIIGVHMDQQGIIQLLDSALVS